MKEIIRTSPLARFFNLLKVDKQEILSIYVYALFSGIVTLSLPLGIQAIINLIRGGQVSTSWIVLLVLVIGGIGLSGAMQLIQLSISENLQQKIFTRSAFEFAYRIPKMKLEELDRSYLPELVNRFFDTFSVQKGLSKILMDFSTASLQVIFGLLLLSLYHSFFILFSVVLFVILYLIFKLTAQKGLKTSLIESKHKYEVAHWLEEMARAMETFKLAGETPLPLHKTDQLVQSYLTSRKAHFKVLMLQYLNLLGFKVVVAAGLLIIGGLLVINEQMNIGQFVASEIIIILVLASVEKLIVSMETIYDVLTAIEKIGLVTDIDLEEDEGIQPDIATMESLSVRVNNLNFKFTHSTKNEISDLSLIFEAGQKICLSGFNGSGKSLLLQLIAGLYESFSGSILYNNVPIQKWGKAPLRSIIGDCLAKEDIFKGTLEENISLGKKGIDIKELQHIVSAVGLTEFVASLEDGYDSILLPEGRNLPKSVRSKIILARSLAGQPKIILVDDMFNQLNEPDKMRFIHHLLSLRCTVIAVSNNPKIAAMFDQVAVLDKGTLIADGTLDEMKEMPWYNNIYANN